MDTTTLKLAGWHDEDTATEGVALFCYAHDHHDSAVMVRSWTDTGCAGTIPSLSDVMRAATEHTATTHRDRDGLALVHRACPRCRSDTCPGRDELNRCTATITLPRTDRPAGIPVSGWGR